MMLAIAPYECLGSFQDWKGFAAEIDDLRVFYERLTPYG
jgi:hypothetical protein